MTSKSDLLINTNSDFRIFTSQVFVNVMTIFNISSVWENAQSTLYCKEAVPILHECNCLNKNATQRQLMDDVTPAYNAVCYTESIFLGL